jgi:hypothetical protein
MYMIRLIFRLAVTPYRITSSGEVCLLYAILLNSRTLVLILWVPALFLMLKVLLLIAPF